MEKKKFNLLIVVMLPLMAVFFACTDDTGEDIYEASPLTGTWELVNVAADVTASDDMEKALASIDLVTTAFAKTGSCYTFYPGGHFLLLTHDGEQIAGTYRYADNRLSVQFDSGGKTVLDVWISGNTMRLDEDFSSRYVYQGSPYRTVTQVTKIHHLVRLAGYSSNK